MQVLFYLSPSLTFTVNNLSSMQKENTHVSRKKFLAWGLGIGSLLTVPAFLRISRQKTKSKTTKMLTQDGRLVEVDMARIPEEKKKIKSEEIHTWIKSKKTL